MPRITAEQAGGANVCAFLDMLRISEIGEALLALSDDGYNVLVGSTPGKPLLFSSYATHPNIYNRREDSTAAGGYQLLGRYWPTYRAQLKLPDFGPQSQDLVAIQQIRERKAYALAQAGHLQAAIALCASCWVSLPGATAGQHVNEYAPLRDAYLAAGGALA